MKESKILDQDDFLDAKPRICGSCWWLKNAEGRRKPCSEKVRAKTVVSEVCDDYCPEPFAICSDCAKFHQKYRGMTCFERGHSPTEEACDGFRASMDKVVISSQEIYHTFLGKPATPIDMKPGAAVTLSAGGTVLLIELLTADTFRVVPLCLDEDKEPTRVGVSQQRETWKFGEAQKVLDDGSMLAVNTEGLCSLLLKSPQTEPEKEEVAKVLKKVEKPKKKPKKVVLEWPKQMSRIDFLEQEWSRIRGLKSKGVGTETKSEASPALLEDLPKITATLTDLLKKTQANKEQVTVDQAVESISVRYSRARNLDPKELNWLKAKLLQSVSKYASNTV